MALRDVGCEDCGALLPMEISSIKFEKPNVWYPGKHCPMCGSEKFYPVVAITETDKRREQPKSLKRRLLLNPWTGIVALVVTVAVVLGIIFLPKRRGDAGEKVLFFCEANGEVFLDSKGSTPPLKCPECGERAGYRAAVCTRCSLVYSYNQKECPYCKSPSRRPLKTMQEVAELKKAHDEYRKQELEDNEFEE